MDAHGSIRGKSTTSESTTPATDAAPAKGLLEQPRRRRGFALLEKTALRALARKGGLAAHERGHAHEFTTEEARAAGHKGGSAPHRSRGGHAHSVAVREARFDRQGHRPVELDGGAAFVPDFRRGFVEIDDGDAETLGEQFIASATSGEGAFEDARNEADDDELDAFVDTSMNDSLDRDEQSV